MFCRLVRTEEENKELKIEMSELRARNKIEIEKVSRDKDREMESVHDRVKQALSKKEDNLKSLREQYELALKRADHLEMLLEQQRKQKNINKCLAELFYRYLLIMNLL